MTTFIFLNTVACEYIGSLEDSGVKFFVCINILGKKKAESDPTTLFVVVAINGIFSLSAITQLIPI